MPYILDTDVLTILRAQTAPAYEALQQRMRQHPTDAFFVTIVSIQEQFRGWLNVVTEGTAPGRRLLWGYDGMLTLLRDVHSYQVLPFDEAALDHFTELRRQRVRIATMDLRIASIALARRATVLTRNLRDFQRVPDLAVEDWTRAED